MGGGDGTGKFNRIVTVEVLKEVGSHVHGSITGRYLLEVCAKRSGYLMIVKIRNVLTRRREYGTYLATARRHRRRIKMQKRDE